MGSNSVLDYIRELYDNQLLRNTIGSHVSCFAR